MLKQTAAVHLQAFNDEEMEADTWLVPTLTKIAHNLHTAATAAEAAGQDPGAAQGPLESCGGELLALFTAAKKGRGISRSKFSVAIVCRPMHDHQQLMQSRRPHCQDAMLSLMLLCPRACIPVQHVHV